MEKKNRINWFPGHMAKMKKELEKELKLVDLVIELRDSRVPFASSNPMLKEMIKNKFRLVILTKALYADQEVTRQFIEYFNKEDALCLDVDLINGKNISLIKNYIRKAAKEILAKRKAKGIINETIRALVIGIPNVGKSTFINKITGRKSLNVGNKPGVTKGMDKWIKVENLELLDTPGILWPKFEDDIVGYKLALVSAIKLEVLPIEEVVHYGLEYVANHYPHYLKERYNLENINLATIIEDIANSKKLYMKGNLIDYNRCYNMIYTDFKNGKIGRISYEHPDESI